MTLTKDEMDELTNRGFEALNSDDPERQHLGQQLLEALGDTNRLPSKIDRTEIDRINAKLKEQSAEALKKV